MSDELAKPEVMLSGPRAALPAISAEQMVLALDKYRELQTALDRAMPEQIMNLDGKPFRKKGYWRAISLAFNLKVEKTEERRELSGKFMDGRDNFGWVVTYRATHPSGRDMTGDGACFAVEKARRFKCPHPESEGSKRTKHFPHNTCPDFDPDFQWRVLPGDATEHNVRSHANTRAFNRAVSNLVGFGEVSAEEVDSTQDSAATAKPAGSGRSEGAQQQTPGAGQVTQSTGGAGAKAGQPEGATKIKSVKVTHGKNARGDWTKYFIRFEDGRSASTFSKSDGEHAQNAEKSGASVIPEIKKEGDFFNLSGFLPWPKKDEAKPQERKDEHANADHDEPVNGPEKILLAREQNTTAGKRWAIQTNKRIVYTDQEQHFKDAVDARGENMSLTPRVEIISGKWRLLGWVEVEEARGTSPAAGSATAPPADAAEAPQAEAGKDGKAPRAPRKKAGAK